VGYGGRYTNSQLPVVSLPPMPSYPSATRSMSAVTLPPRQTLAHIAGRSRPRWGLRFMLVLIILGGLTYLLRDFVPGLNDKIVEVKTTVREVAHQYGLINDSPRPLMPPSGELPADPATTAATAAATGVAVARAPIPAKSNGHPDIQPMAPPPPKPAALVAGKTAPIAAPGSRGIGAGSRAVAPARAVVRRRAGGFARRRRLAAARAAAGGGAGTSSVTELSAADLAAEDGAAPAPKAKVAPVAALPKAAAAAAPAEAKAPAEAPAPPSEAVKKAAGSGDELDELMASAVGPSKRGSDLDKKLATVQKGEAAPAAKAAAASTKAAPLSRADIETAMKGVKDEMGDCYAKTGKGGPVDLSISVSPEGDVKNTVIKGDMAGTSTGACVAQKVKATVFPPSTGLNFNYRLVVK
jgi:hypothetical protein